MPSAGQHTLHAVPVAAAASATAARHTWSLRTSFWAVVAAQALLLAASNFPTPLFPIYERQYGFSSGVVTLLFGAYVVALIPAMLTLGRLTDRIGRRTSLVAGMSVTAVSSLAFAAARNVGWLFAGEIIYGIAAGLVMSSAPVAIRELHPKQSLAGGALAVTLAAASGLALGPLVSGFLATVTPWPTVAPYALDIVLAVVLSAVLLRIPETRPNHPAPAKRPPALHVPVEIRRAFVPTALAGAAGWMLTGWVLGLSPSFLHEELDVHVTQPVVSGLFAALVIVSNGAAQLGFRRHNTVRSMRTALIVMVSGMAVIASSTLVDSLAIALLGAVIAGAGAGVVQMSTMATTLRIAPLHARGGVTSAFLTVGYIGMSVPVIIAGLTAERLGLGVVSGWYLAGLTVVAAAAVAIAHHAAESHAPVAMALVQVSTVDEPSMAAMCLTSGH